MHFIVLAVGVSALGVADDQAKKLIDTIVALQAPLEDYRCEFEGIVHLASQTAPGSDVAVSGRHDAFSGMFLWRKGGDFWCDNFHEDAQAPRKIERRTMVVRSRDHHAEEHRRFNDAVEGQRMFGSPSIFRTRLDLEGPQGLLLLEDLRDQPPNEAHTVSARDDQIDGRALKVLEIRVKDIDQLLRRYWIDLGRNGHVVRLEVYWTGERLRLRRDIKLAKFGLAGAQIWMPVSAEQVTYSPPTASETGESQLESNATISMLNGTTAFNANLDAKNFAIDYRAGKLISASGAGGAINLIDKRSPLRGSTRPCRRPSKICPPKKPTKIQVLRQTSCLRVKPGSITSHMVSALSRSSHSSEFGRDGGSANEISSTNYPETRSSTVMTVVASSWRRVKGTILNATKLGRNVLVQQLVT